MTMVMTKMEAKKSSASYIQKIEQRTLLQRRLAEARERISEVSSVAGSRRLAVQEANNEVDRFERECRDRNKRQGHGTDLDQYQSEQMDRLKKKAADADRASSEASSAFQQLTDEISAIESDLANYKFNIGSEDVIVLDKDIAAAEKNVIDLKEHIARQGDIIRIAESGIKPDVSMATERENLMADIATGAASADQLAALDTRIAEAKSVAADSTAKANAVIEPARLALAGLQRKLEDAERKLLTLKDVRTEVLFHYLMGRAEDVGKEYVNLAEKLVAKFEQLLAIDNIMGAPSRLRTNYWHQLSIPVFRLTAFRNAAHRRHPEKFSAAVNAVDESEMQSAIEAERQKISDEGVRL